MAGAVLDALFAPPHLHELSDRERIVLHHVASPVGLSTVASRLRVSPNTLRTQSRSLYRKLDVSSRLEALDRLATTDGVRPAG
jgi:DNA-binding NarL/FixJ family response regulator